MIYIQNGKTQVIIPINTQSERKCITQEGVLYCEKTQMPEIPPTFGVILAGTLLLFMVIGAFRVARDFDGTIGDYIIGAVIGFILWFSSILLLAVFETLLNGVL